MSERVSVFGGRGRPSRETAEQRRLDFIRFLSEGYGLAEAQRRSKIDPLRVLRLLDGDTAFRQAAFQLTCEAKAA